MYTFARDMDFFFADPIIPPESHRRPAGEHSVLYLLRREVQDCLFGDILPEDKAQEIGDKRRLFASAMVIFAGIDLLAKFHASDDRTDGGQIRKRFKSFLRQYFKLTDSEANALWAVRNSLMHSFGLFDTRASKRIALVHMAGGAGEARSVEVQADWYVVRVDALYRDFVSALRAYEADLRTANVPPRRIDEMYGKYGTIWVSDAMPDAGSWTNLAEPPWFSPVQPVVGLPMSSASFVGTPDKEPTSKRER